jgi:hypothetical protein
MNVDSNQIQIKRVENPGVPHILVKEYSELQQQT